MNQPVVVRVNSHRAGGKLASALGTKPQYYYTWEHGGCFVVLTTQEAAAVLPITGITRSRVKFNELSKCW
jgi:hypothetical protein